MPCWFHWLHWIHIEDTPYLLVVASVFSRIKIIRHWAVSWIMLELRMQCGAGLIQRCRSASLWWQNQGLKIHLFFWLVFVGWEMQAFLGWKGWTKTSGPETLWETKLDFCRTDCWKWKLIQIRIKVSECPGIIKPKRWRSEMIMSPN